MKTKSKRRAKAAPNPKVVTDLKTMGILPEGEDPSSYPAIGPDDTWDKLDSEKVIAAKKEIIATLIKAGRPDLANEVSRSLSGRAAVKAAMFKDKALEKKLDNIADGADSFDVTNSSKLAFFFPEKGDAQTFEKKAGKVPGAKSVTLWPKQDRDGMFIVYVQAKVKRAKMRAGK